MEFLKHVTEISTDAADAIRGGKTCSCSCSCSCAQDNTKADTQSSTKDSSAVNTWMG